MSKADIYNKNEAIQKMNQLGHEGTPFVFVIDYEMEKIRILTEPHSQKLFYDINGFSNTAEFPIPQCNFFEVEAIDRESYTRGFNYVQNELHYGNSFLANLSFASKIQTDLTLQEIFHASVAKYRLYIPGQCVVFSPESFIQIRNNKISSYPMKGTIQANIENAETRILEDIKEKAEHSTIVDLIRNDLSIIAKNVRVENFRYIERIDNNKNPLLQVSSKITGDLAHDFCANLGDSLFSLLPAGSISGAPKNKTIEIIAEAEIDKRGYYTGVFGYFDGENLDSAVMIRFIEEKNGQMYFRSGGGITAYSNLDSEYAELIDKIYVPLRKHKDTQRKNIQSPLSSSAI